MSRQQFALFTSTRRAGGSLQTQNKAKQPNQNKRDDKNSNKNHIAAHTKPYQPNLSTKQATFFSTSNTTSQTVSLRALIYFSPATTLAVQPAATMPANLKSKAHAASDEAAFKADPEGFERRREEFVQRMIAEGLAKLEEKLKTRKGKRVFRDEVRFQKGLHKEATKLRSLVSLQYRRELMLLETAVKAARTIDWTEFVKAARPLRKKLGGRAIQVMWWAMNTSERTEIQITDLNKWLKGKSRLNNELAIRLRAKLAMFSDLIHQIRDKARVVYRDGDPRFQTYCLEALMVDYSAMEQRATDAAGANANFTADTVEGLPKRLSSSSLKNAIGDQLERENVNRNVLTAKVQVTGRNVSHAYQQVLNSSQNTWKLQQVRTADIDIGEKLTVQIGARSYLAEVPDVPVGSLFDMNVPGWMRAYLIDQEESDFMASARAAKHSSPAIKRSTSVGAPKKLQRGYSVKKGGYTDSMMDVILMDDESAATTAVTVEDEDVSEANTKEGNLKKQGATLGLWHTRYFRLHVHFLAYWKTKSAYLRGQGQADSTGKGPYSSPGKPKKKKSFNKKNKSKTVDEVQPSCEHKTITDLQASNANTVTPEACFDLHLLQSAVVESEDIVLTFTTTGNESIVRRLRAPSYASALSWQEAIYQHYTWYCTNKETELLAFMDMAQQNKRHNGTDLNRELEETITRPRCQSTDGILGVVTKSRRAHYRNRGVADRVRDSPRSHGNRMKSTMASREEAKTRREQRKAAAQSVSANKTVKRTSSEDTFSMPQTPPVRRAHRPRAARPGSESSCASDGSDTAAPPPPPSRADIIPAPEQQQPRSRPNALFRLALKAAGSQNKRLSGRHFQRPDTPPPSRDLRRRAVNTSNKYLRKPNPSGAPLSPHQRILVGARRPGWAHQNDGMPPPPAHSPRSPHKGRAPMSPLTQRGQTKQRRFGGTPDSVTKSTSFENSQLDRKDSENDCPLPPSSPTTDLRIKQRPRSINVAPPPVPHPKHSRSGSEDSIGSQRSQNSNGSRSSRRLTKKRSVRVYF